MELSDVSIDIMKRIKNVFDPKGYLIPGRCSLLINTKYRKSVMSAVY